MTDYLDGQHYDLRPHICDIKTPVGGAFYSAPTFTADISAGRNVDGTSTVLIKGDGRIFWNGREIETDDEFKGCMMELRNVLMRGK